VSPHRQSAQDRTVTTKPLLPQTFWFRIAANCPRVEDFPRLDNPWALLDLPASCALPELAQLDGRKSWAEVRVGWNARGLGIAIRADGVADLQLQPDRPEGFANAHLWVDTRDSRNVSRATRFCTRFGAHLSVRGAKKQLTVEVGRRPIARATAEPPVFPDGLINSRSELSRAKWMLELFLPAQVLHGFDPETNRRLGFAYQIADHVREDQFLGVGRDFPLGENPSLWSTLELRD
jgi:hypothetical protein